METFFSEASRVMTVVSLLTFMGIIWWTFSKRRQQDFETAAHLPFADDFSAAPVTTENEHV